MDITKTHLNSAFLLPSQWQHLLTVKIKEIIIKKKKIIIAVELTVIKHFYNVNHVF